MRDPSRIIDAYLDGSLDEQVLAQLEQDLCDPGYADLFAQAMLIDSMLSDRFERDELAATLKLGDGSFLAEQDLAVLAEDYDNADVRIVSFEDRLRATADKAEKANKAKPITPRELISIASYLAAQGLRTKAGVISSIAAVFVLGAVLYVSLLGFDSPPTSQTIADNNQSKPAASVKPTPRGSNLETTPVATLTATHNATWAEGAFARGSKLHPGDKLTLTAGFAQITTQQGAVAILQAPCAVELIDHPNALRLHDGKMVGRCETRLSRGFSVLTDHARVVDLGTVFGVEQMDGITRASVFEGEVVVTSAGPEASDAQPVYLKQGQSAQVDQLSRVERFTPAAQSRFVRDIKPVAQPPQVTGQIEYRPSLPTSIAPGDFESDRISLFAEKRSVVLENALRVTLTQPGSYDYFAPPSRKSPTIAAGLSVDSYLVHCDLIGRRQSATPRTATIRFDQPIVGVLAHSSDLMKTDRLFAAAGVDYGQWTSEEGNNLGRGLERVINQPADIVELSEDRKTLTVTLVGGLAIDQLRILVQSPEPTIE